jgi:hypothetical protein
MIKLDLKKLNIFTIISLLLLLAGILFYVYWGIRFGVWYDVGIYSITIVFVLGGLLGTILTLMVTPQD